MSPAWDHFVQFAQSVAPLPATELAYLQSRVRPARLRKGEDLPPNHLALVSRGIFQSGVTSENGKNQVLSLNPERDILVPMSYFPNDLPGDSAAHRRSLAEPFQGFSIRALEDAEVLLIPVKEFRALFSRHPAWETLGRFFAERAFLLKAKREHDFHALSASQRLAQLREQNPDLVARVPRHVLASYLGITPVALSRLAARKRRKKTP